MLIIKKGNLLKATENLICHQVNCEGVMGAGIALQIANKYPHVEFTYKEFCRERTNGELLGKFIAVNTSPEERKYILNCFSQVRFKTDYELFENIFKRIKEYASINNLTIAIPYKMGCGIALGDWQTIEEILIDIFDDYDCICYKWNGG